MTNEEIELYLRELGSLLKKKLRKTHYKIEIVIVGGASVLLNYGFRESTQDIDAYNDKLSSIKESVNEIRDKYNLTDDWLNSDFQYTSSFTENIRQYAKHYKTYGNTLIVYTIDEEYLICMKLVAFRTDKHDLDDIVGIISNAKETITLSKIDKAMHDLYGGWSLVSDEAKEFITALSETLNHTPTYKQNEDGKTCSVSARV